MNIYILICIILSIFLLIFSISLFIYYKAFGKRWEPDGIIKYYQEEDYINFKSEDVSIKTKKGILRGKKYYYQKDNYKGIFIFSHGMWSSHRSYIQEIEILAANGYYVLSVDAYGTDLSDGKAIKGLGNSLFVLDETIKYSKKFFNSQDIYVMGHSWGGYAALNISKIHNDINKIVIMSPFISVKDALKTFLPKYLYICIPFLIFFDFINFGKYSLYNGKKSIKNTNTKTLILHSKDDLVIPYNKSTNLLEKINNKNISFYIVDGKNHNPDYKYSSILYTKECLEKIKIIKDKDLKLAYKKSIDYHKMGEIDTDVFNIILEFIKGEKENA